MTSEKQKQYHKERYEWLKNKGICVCCGRDNACIGSVYCPECGEKNAEKVREYYRTNRDERNNYNKEYNKRIRAERKAKGLCVKCGRKAIDGQTLCLECRTKERKWKKAKRNNDVERSMRPELGLCYICGKPLNKWDKLCDDCHEKASERAKKLQANPTETMLRAREEYVNRHRQSIERCFCKKQNSHKAKGEEK